MEIKKKYRLLKLLCIYIIAVIVSAIIFYMTHGTPMNIGTLIFGLFAGWMIIKAKSIIPGVIIHFVWNTIIFFLPVIASNIANAM